MTRSTRSHMEREECGGEWFVCLTKGRQTKEIRGVERGRPIEGRKNGVISQEKDSIDNRISFSTPPPFHLS